MKKSSLLFALFVLLFSANHLWAQEPEETLPVWRVETKDGNDYIGFLLSVQGDDVILGTDHLGILHIPKDEVKDMFRVDGAKMKNNQISIPHFQSARYFWSPNGYGMKKGEAYYQNIMFLYNHVSVGVTNHFSLGFGIVPILFGGGDYTPIWITPKVSIPVVKDKFNVGGGGLFGTFLGEGDPFGVAYAVSTFGSKDKNFTIGIGYGFSGETWFDRPTINISGMIRTGKRGYLISENYIFNTGGYNWGLMTFGGRTVGKRISIDYGAVFYVGSDGGGTIPLPWASIVIPLKRRKR